jgi:hypothetical protein
MLNDPASSSGDLHVSAWGIMFGWEKKNDDS